MHLWEYPLQGWYSWSIWQLLLFLTDTKRKKGDAAQSSRKQSVSHGCPCVTGYCSTKHMCFGCRVMWPKPGVRSQGSNTWRSTQKSTLGVCALGVKAFKSASLAGFISVADTNASSEHVTSSPLQNSALLPSQTLLENAVLSLSMAQPSPVCLGCCHQPGLTGATHLPRNSLLVRHFQKHLLVSWCVQISHQGNHSCARVFQILLPS